MKRSLEIDLIQREKELAAQSMLLQQGFEAICSKYQKTLETLGAETSPVPAQARAQNYFDWFNEELDSLPEVASIAGNNCAMLGYEAVLNVLQSENKELLNKMYSKGFHFPGDIEVTTTPRNIQVIKRRFFRDFWDVRGRKIVQDASLARLQEVTYFFFPPQPYV